MLVGVAGVTSKTQSIQRSVVGDRTGAVGPPVVDDIFGCGSWTLASWQHQESGHRGGSEDGGSRAASSASSTVV